MTRALDLRRGVAVVMAVAASTVTGCRTAGDGGPSPSFLIIESIHGASGAEPDAFGAVLFSDVETIVGRQFDGQTRPIATVFADAGRVSFRLGLKDPGTPANPNEPSTINEITITRYRVSFRRADGRNTPGVDVPYGFDGALTVTVPGGGGTASVNFELVRRQMKQEPPLGNLAGGGGASLISTIAEVTFWGRDQAGNEATVSGRITVNFGDFADPE